MLPSRRDGETTTGLAVITGFRHRGTIESAAEAILIGTNDGVVG